MEKINLEDYKNDAGLYDVRKIANEDLLGIYEQMTDNDSIMLNDQDECIIIEETESNLQ